MRIAVLITCFNRVETTLRCLKGLLEQELPAQCCVDIYLVDDASPDQTGAKVKAWFGDRCDSRFNCFVIKGTGNLFWCKGMRLAWDTAIGRGVDYDYWMWLNDDVLLCEGAFVGVIRDDDIVMRRDGKAGIIVGTFCPSKEDCRATYGLCDERGRVVQPNGIPQWQDGELMNGNLVLIPRSVYTVVGPIFGGYSHGYADSDYRMMCKGKGIKAYASSTIVGICPREPRRYLNYVKTNMIGRIRMLNKPKGIPICDAVLYRWRHWGALRAGISLLHIIWTTLSGR